MERGIVDFFYSSFSVFLFFQRLAIFLEEDVFPSSDFLNFFRQCLPSVEADDTLVGISAWNDNGHSSFSLI